MSWSGVRKALEPIFKARGESTKYVRFNLEYGDEKGGLKGNIVEADLARIFGGRWERHPRKTNCVVSSPRRSGRRITARSARNASSSGRKGSARRRRAALAERLIHEFGASREEAEAIVKLHFPQGWEPFSTKALEIFLPKLEKGVRFGALVNGPECRGVGAMRISPDREQPTGEILDRLPSPRADCHAGQEQREEARRIAGVRNPTVVRVQNELRKVVNNLIGPTTSRI